MEKTRYARFLDWVSQAPWRGRVTLALAALVWLLFFSLVMLTQAKAVTVREMIGDNRYWPPACEQNVCVLTGLGGLVNVWTDHVDENMAKGRSFVVKGICASACEIAARRANAEILPGARLIVHVPSKAVWH